MTKRKLLKKELSRLRAYKKALPRLIDCSQAYGDDYFNEGIYKEVDKKIAELEQKIQVMEISSLSKEILNQSQTPLN